MPDLNGSCAIVGIANTSYVRGAGKSTLRLHLEASIAAMEDAGLSPKDIDGYLPYVNSNVIAEEIILNLGIADLRYSVSIHQGAASAGTSIENAVAAINAGMTDYVLLTVGRSGYSEGRVSKMAERPGALVMPQFKISDEFEAPYGVSSPVQLFAASMRRHMHLFGTTSRQFGALAMACRKHAQLNPNAFMYGKPMTMDDYLNSRMIADPLRLFDCSLETDGAGAVIITSAERARDLKKEPVYIAGIASGHPDRPSSETAKPVMHELSGVRKAARRAFDMAGLTPKDVDTAQIHDGVSWILLCQIEDIGFCKKGEGGPFVEGGRIELGGELPVNTSGGAMSEAHVSGVNHIIEAVRQLRREANGHQVKDAEIVLVSLPGDFGDGSVMLLTR